MKELLAIYDTDNEYVKRLKSALNEDAAFPFFAVTAASREELDRILSEEQIQVLLISGKEEIPEGVKTVFRMTEVPGYVGGELSFCKYLPVGKIKEEILRKQSAFLDAEESADRPGDKTMYIGIASPVGRALKTSFGLVLGQLLAQNAHTLYVNLEPCPGTEVLFGRKPAKDLADVLFAGTREDWDGKESVEEQLHGLSLFPTAAVPEDIYQTDPAFLKEVLRKYVHANGYEAVVLDLGTEYRILEEFVPSLNKLYIPSRKEPVQEAKAAEFLEWVGRIADEEFREKAEVITLPMPGIFSRSKYDPEQLLFTELGDTVRSMLGGMY